MNNSFNSQWIEAMTAMGFNKEQMHGLAFWTGAYHFYLKFTPSSVDTIVVNHIAPTPYNVERYGQFSEKMLSDILGSSSKILYQKLEGKDFDSELREISIGKLINYDFDSSLELGFENYKSTRALTWHYLKVHEKLGKYLISLGNEIKDCYASAWVYFSMMYVMDSNGTLLMLKQMNFESIPIIKTVINYPTLYGSSSEAFSNFHWISYLLNNIIEFYDSSYASHDYLKYVWSLHFLFLFENDGSIRPTITDHLSNPDLTISILKDLLNAKKYVQQTGGQLIDYSGYDKHPNPSIINKALDKNDLIDKIQEHLIAHGYGLKSECQNLGERMQLNMLTLFATSLFSLSVKN